MEAHYDTFISCRLDLKHIYDTSLLENTNRKLMHDIVSHNFTYNIFEQITK